jgi:hypothetical protein
MVYVETLGFRLDFAFEAKFRYVHDSFIQMKTKTGTNNHTESKHQQVNLHLYEIVAANYYVSSSR